MKTSIFLVILILFNIKANTQVAINTTENNPTEVCIRHRLVK